MKTKIPYNVLQAISLFQAKNDVRYYLNGVLLQRTSHETRLVATNGHYLALWRRSEEPESEPVEVIIPRDTILGALKFARTRAEKSEDFEVEFDETDNIIRISHSSSQSSAAPVDGKFVDYARVIPSAISGEVMQFNPDYLALFGRADRILRGVGPSSSPFVAVHHNGKGPALIELLECGENFVGVLGPQRVNAAGDPLSLVAGV